MSKLMSVNVGRPREVEWNGKTVRTAIWKSPIQGRVHVGRTNIAGDEQADRQGHGGEQRAVLVYQLSSYRYWSQALERDDFDYGQFGENLTVEGLEDADVNIGDRYRIGTVLFEVTQPRVTCYRLGIRMGHPELPALLVTHQRPGFYMRVIEEGEIGAGDDIVKVAEGPEKMSVADIDSLLYSSRHPVASLTRALRIPALSVGWRESFAALLKADGLVTGNAALDSLKRGGLAWAGFRKARVASIIRESADVRSFWLEPVDAPPLPAAKAGHHIAVRQPADTSGTGMARMYSLSAPVNEGRYRISVKREQSGAFSRYLHAEVRVGAILEIAAPQGEFVLGPERGPVVLISAGVGVTPLLAMLHALSTRRLCDREVWWFHGARDGRHHAFRQEAEILLARIAGARSFISYSRPGQGDVLGDGFDGIGRLSILHLEQQGVPKDAKFFLCGPAAFMRDFSAELEAWGADPQSIHSERFGSAAQQFHRPHPPAGNSEGGHAIHFVRSGLSVRWSNRYQSLLELAEACEVPVRWSCRTGVCHSCQVQQLDGGIEYAPAPVALPAQGTILLCCAKPTSDTHIDL